MGGATDDGAEAERRAILAELDQALAESDALVPLSEERFLKSHVLYEGRSAQQSRIVDWFADHVEGNGQAPASYRVLSVGCGSGVLDLAILDRWQARLAAIEYTGVDPNAAECEAFESAFAQADLDQVELEVVRGRFEEALDGGSSFDLVHLVHCLYYMADAAESLRQARALCDGGGELVVFHAPCEALNDLATRFYDKLYGRPTLFAREVEALLESWGWSFARHRVDAWVDITPLIDGPPEHPVGRALRDFIVQVDSQALSAPVRSLVDRYLETIVRRADGAALVAHPVDAFVIRG